MAGHGSKVGGKSGRLTFVTVRQTHAPTARRIAAACLFRTVPNLSHSSQFQSAEALGGAEIRKPVNLARWERAERRAMPVPWRG